MRSRTSSREKFKAKREEIQEECDDQATLIRELLPFAGRGKRLEYERNLVDLLEIVDTTKSEEKLIKARGLIRQMKQELYDNSLVREVNFKCNYCGGKFFKLTQEWDGTKWEPSPSTHTHAFSPPTAWGAVFPASVVISNDVT